MAEGVFRAFSPRESVLPVGEDRPLFYYKPANTFSYKNLKYASVKDEKNFRIAVIGDSFTYPHLIQFDDAYPQRLERMLNINHAGDQNFDERSEVINYGVPGLSTIQELDYVKQALKGQPDILILEITLNNPWAEGLASIEKRSHHKLVFHPLLIDDSHNRLLNYFKSFGFIARRIHNSTTHKSFVRYHHWLFEQDHTWGMFSESVKAMNNLCKHSNVHFIAFIFLFFNYHLDGSYPFLDIHQKIRSFLEAKHIPYLDLLDVYRGMDNERLQVLPNVDAHPSELAHRIAAEQIYLWLEQLEYLPAHAVIKEKYRKRGPGPRKVNFDPKTEVYVGHNPAASHGFRIEIRSF